MIHQQSVFEPWPIECESVQSVICSPPYFALRKYSIPDVIIGGDKDCKHEFISKQDHNSTSNKGVVGNKEAREFSSSSSSCIHCNAWKGQYGLEPTPQMYVEHTRLWAKEAWRVLRNDGIFFLNIADSYNGPGKGNSNTPKQSSNTGSNIDNPLRIKNYPSKCQLLIPHHVAISLVEDGWTLRNTIIWYKTNGMPESVTDRFSKKYEYIFMFTKQEKYYFVLDAVREEQSEASKKRAEFAIRTNETYENRKDVKFGHEHINGSPTRLNRKNIHSNILSQGKNPGDVWQIPTQPSSEKHFAMWPERLVERMVKCSTKAGNTVLDCFAGSGTTLKVAEQLHRKGIGIDLGYHEISKRRTSKIQKELFV